MKPNSKRAKAKMAHLRKQVTLTRQRARKARRVLEVFRVGLWRTKQREIAKRRRINQRARQKKDYSRWGRPLSTFELDRVKAWCDLHQITIHENGNVILFKRVSDRFKTQEHSPNETTWRIGKTKTLKSWMPRIMECGPGKFHACSRPYDCDQFRRGDVGDRYIAIRVNIKDMFVWNPNNPYNRTRFPHKVAFRKGKVLYECDRRGFEIK